MSSLEYQNPSLHYLQLNKRGLANRTKQLTFQQPEQNKGTVVENKRLSNLQANEDLECVVDAPLCSCQGTDHDNPERQSPSHQAN